MGSLLIREYSHLARDDYGRKGWAVAEPALASDTFTTTNESSVVDNPINDETRFVLLSVDVDTKVEFGHAGSTPVATSDSLSLLAGQEITVAVAPGSVIAAVAGAGEAPGYDFTVGSYDYTVGNDPPVPVTIYGFSRFGAEPYPDDYGNLSPNTFAGATIVHFGDDTFHYAVLKIAGAVQIPGIDTIQVTLGGVTENLGWVGGMYSEYSAAAAQSPLRAAIVAATGTTVLVTLVDVT